MRLYFALIFILAGLSINAQVRDIRSTTELFSEPNTRSNALGVFARGSRVRVIDVKFQMAYVETNTQMRGYVNANLLVDHTNGRDIHAPDPVVFKQSEDYYFERYGMHIQVAGLRARTAPSSSGKVYGLVKMNEWCRVDFLPYDENGWVKIGQVYNEATNESEPYFVQRKYLGKYIDIKDVITEYSSLETNQARKKMLAERILEMSYFEEFGLRLKALKLYQTYALENHITFDKEALEFEIYVLKCYCNFDETTDTTPHRQVIESLDYLVNDVKVLDWSVSKLKALNWPFDTTSTFPAELGECGWGFQMAYYTKGLVLIDEGDGRALNVWRVDFTNFAITIKVDDYIISGNTKEKDFLKAMGPRLYNKLRDGMHSYYFGDDGIIIEVVFENEKIILFDMSNQC